MFAVNYSTLRENMKSYFDRVSDDKDTMIVTRKNENVVVMSQSTYDSIMETLYLVTSKNNAQHLMKSIHQYQSGRTTSHDLAEADDE